MRSVCTDRSFSPQPPTLPVLKTKEFVATSTLDDRTGPALQTTAAAKVLTLTSIKDDRKGPPLLIGIAYKLSVHDSKSGGIVTVETFSSALPNITSATAGVLESPLFWEKQKPFAPKGETLQATWQQELQELADMSALVATQQPKKSELMTDLSTLLKRSAALLDRAAAQAVTISSRQ